MSNHISQFDALATLYDDMMNWPFRKEIEIPAVLENIGDVSGLSVLDFGCGSGYYARLLKSLGAKRVVGYDVAGGMLDHARERELMDPQGVEYISTLPGLEHQFDLVLGIYVLPYACNREQLHVMANSMVKLVRPEGRLITLPLNPQYATDHDYYVPYGFNLSADIPYQDGCEVYLHLPQGDKKTTITAWYWSQASMNEAFEMAGLTDIRWTVPHPQNFSSTMNLKSYIDKPHTMLVEGRYTGNKK
ncbi:class I SAM-dependent methyltransferase [Serratia sp. NA_112.1]|uniref:class I SAM-dependent methyltransferase n=1 Tax=Serratia sp. NA_112.1 TaxID=3415665 RepID=UPI0040468E2D